MELVRSFFPDLTPAQMDLLERHRVLFQDWNTKINLVSRQDIDHFEEHHLLHAMALAKVVQFAPGQRVLDVGTGGGLPGLPLAILFPQTRFFLCDSMEKKVKAVRAMVTDLGLKNVEVVHKRAETLESKWDFITGRAVSALPQFLSWIQKNTRVGGSREVPYGVLYWKGTLYREELDSLGLKPFKVHAIDAFLPRPYFAEKFIVHLSSKDVQNVSFAHLEAAKGPARGQR